MRLLCILMLITVLPVWGQLGGIKGKVTDVKGEGLIGVNIMTNVSVGTVTDINGDYKIELGNGEYQIRFSYMGFQNTKRKILIEDNQVLDLNITLQEKSNQLDVYVVSASNYKKEMLVENISMDVLDASLVENNNAIELGEAVDKSVGVQVQEGQILIRGGSAWSYGVGARTAVLVDNLNMISADLNDPQMKQAPIEIMDKIEVVKGAASVVYGSSALNGIVNLITKWPGAEPETKLSIFHGLYGAPPRPEMVWWEDVQHPSFTGLSFSHAQRYKNTDVVVGANFYNNFSYLWKGDELRYRANFKLRYRDPDKPGLMYGVNGNVMYENSGRFFLAEDALDNAYRRLDGSNDEYVRYNIDPHWTYVKENGDNHKVRGRFLNVTRLPSDNASQFNSNLLMVDYQFQKKINDNLQLVSGLPLQVGIAKSNLYEGWRATGAAAFYSQIEYIKDKVSIMGGARYELSAVDIIYSTALPVFRAGLNYKLKPKTSIRASLGQAYRLPSIGERFISASFSGLKIVPNQDLAAETGWGSELGLKHRIDFGNFSAFLDGAFFLNEYKNFVEYTLGLYPEEGNAPTLDDLGLKPLNLPDSRVAGYELSVFGKGTVGEVNINTLLGYSYNYPADLGGDSSQRNLGTYFSNFIWGMGNRYEDYTNSDGEAVELENKILAFRTRHILKADIELEWKKFRVGYNLNFMSFPEKIPLLYEQAVSHLGTYIDNNGDYDVLHSIRIAYDVKENINLSFIGKNITNDEYFRRIGLMDAPQNYTVKMVFTL
tara:strand:+ start:692 stop:3004 length:2313 start_codon:yes stop_codon:yes gene_type:complete